MFPVQCRRIRHNTRSYQLVDSDVFKPTLISQIDFFRPPFSLAFCVCQLSQDASLPLSSRTHSRVPSALHCVTSARLHIVTVDYDYLYVPILVTLRRTLRESYGEARPT